MFDECTLTERDVAAPRTVAERLRAGSDPVYAFRLHGHDLDGLAAPAAGGASEWDEATPRPSSTAAGASTSFTRPSSTPASSRICRNPASNSGRAPSSSSISP